MAPFGVPHFLLREGSGYSSEASVENAAAGRGRRRGRNSVVCVERGEALSVVAVAAVSLSQHWK